MRAQLSKLMVCNCFEKQDRVDMGKRARAQAVDKEPRSSGMNRTELGKMLNSLK